MKTFTLSLVIVMSTITVLAQPPQAINYQAAVRDTNGTIVSNQSISLKISILSDSINGTVVYSETHYATTNNFGLVNLAVGRGVVLGGDFSVIDWSGSKHFIKTEVDLSGGSSFVLTGVSQLLSVPYALHSGTSGDSYWMKNNSGIYYNRNVGIGTSDPNFKLDINDSVNDNKQNSIVLNVSGGNTDGRIYRGFYSQINGTGGTNRAVQGYSYGISNGWNAGIAGFADSADVNVGIYSRVYYENPTGFNYGVNATSLNSEYSNIAVGAYADYGNTTTGFNFGVSSRAASTTSQTNYGIYSEASNGAYNYAGYFAGDVTVTGTFSNPSDITLKFDITPITSALSIIDNLNPVKYYNKPDEKFSFLNLPGDLQYGFIAQDMEKVLPTLVKKQIHPGSEKGSSDIAERNTYQSFEFKGINYIGIIPILAKGIKEQQIIIDSLEKKLSEFEERIQKLEK